MFVKKKNNSLSCAVHTKRIRATPPTPRPSHSDGLQSEKRCSRMINQPQRQQSVGTPVFLAGQDSILSLNVSVNETSRGSFSPPRHYSIPQRSSCIDSDTFAQRRGKELVRRGGCSHGGLELGRIQTTVVQRFSRGSVKFFQMFGLLGAT